MMRSATVDLPATAMARGPIHYLFCVVLAVQTLYVFGFNSLPDLVRNGLSGLLFCIHLTLAVLTLLARPRSWNLLLLLAVLLTIVTWIPAHIFHLGEVDAVRPAEFLRNIAWPLMLIWILSYPMALPRGFFCWYALIFTLLGAVVAFTGPAVYVSGTPRLGSITAGLDNMHASAKLMALQVILIDQLRRARLLDPKIAWGLVAVAAAVLLGYGGRNEQLFVLIYFGALYLLPRQHDLLLRFGPFVALGFIVIAGAVILQIVDDPGDLGSGRIGVWSYRLGLLAERNPVTFLFGGGVGSDVIWTPQWRYMEDGSTAHNDYLHAMMESGLVGVVVMFVILYALWLRLTLDGRAIVVAIAVNSFFSNGFFNTPLLALNLSFVMAVSLMGGLLRAAEPPPEPSARYPTILPGGGSPRRQP